MAPPFSRRESFARTALTLGAMVVVFLAAAVWLGVPGVRPSRADLIAARSVVADSEALIASPCILNLGATTEIDWVGGTVRLTDLEVLPEDAGWLLREELREQGLEHVDIKFADPRFQDMTCDLAG